MNRLFPAIFLHILFLAALAGGVGVSLPKSIPQAIARGTSWEISSAQKAIFPWGEHPAQANNLSGIAWLGGDRYALVADKGGNILWGEIRVDFTSGAILSAQILPQVTRIKGGIDLEDVALASDGRSLIVCDEDDAALSRIPLAWGMATEQTPVERITGLFKDCRNNLSLESAATAVDGSGYWTISEDALVRDGARASIQTDLDRSSGAWLRLLKVDAGLRPVRQWAYGSDAIPGGFPIPRRVSGVSSLAALPDGRLIVMERALGLGGFRIRLYLVEPEAALPDATSVSNLSKDAGVQLLPKALLYEWNGLANFEGITLGPTLANGDRLLLLVVDDGDHISRPGLWALRLHRVLGKPGSAGPQTIDR